MGKKTRAEHRDDNETGNLGSATAVVKRFLQSRRANGVLDAVGNPKTNDIAFGSKARVDGFCITLAIQMLLAESPV